MKWLVAVILPFFVQTTSAQKTQPIIDMHLHALYADAQGPPPISVGAPYRDLGLNDPKNDFRKTFMKALKEKMWADRFVTSPSTDDSMKLLTLQVLKKYNVYAVTSGDAALVNDWKKTEPDRIIKGFD